MSKKKPTFPINEMLDGYLKRYKRNIKIPIFYEDLLRFQGSVTVFDKNDEDTLWVRVYYSEWDREEIDLSLKKIYTILHSDGNDNTIPFLNIDAIDFCTFGNSKPFRIIKRKRENLEDVIYYEGIAQVNDSILRMVSLPKEEQLAIYRAYTEELKLKAEEEAERKEEELRKQAAQKAQTAAANNTIVYTQTIITTTNMHS